MGQRKLRGASDIIWSGLAGPLLASLLIGYFLLLRPGYLLYRLKAREWAAHLFDRASYYPLSQFVLISVFLTAEKLLGW